MPSKKKRALADQWYFELLKEAYGYRCCSCGKCEAEVGPLQRGHIVRHTSDGSTEPENIIPVCRKCNNKHTLGDTPSKYFPEDWRERLAGLLLLRLNPKYHVDTVADRDYMVLKSKPAENTRVINLQSSDFGLPKEGYTRPRQHGLPPHEKHAAVKELVDASRTCATPPNLPSVGRQEQMRKLVADNGRDTFLRVGAYFLKQQLWITPDNRFIQDSWQQFCDGFDFLLNEMLASEERRRVADQEQRKRREEQERLDEILAAKRFEERKQRIASGLKAEIARADSWPNGDGTKFAVPLTDYARLVEVATTDGHLDDAQTFLDNATTALDNLALEQGLF